MMFISRPNLALLVALAFVASALAAVAPETEIEGDVADRLLKMAINKNLRRSQGRHDHVDPTKIVVRDKTEKDKNDDPRDVSSNNVIKTSMRGLGLAIKSYLSQTDGSGLARRSLNSKSTPWYPKIPLIFTPSYSDPFNRNIVKRVLRYLNIRTCLTLIDETDNWDSSNNNWFKENGYDVNAYIKIISGDGCSTSGNGAIEGTYVEVKPCTSTDVVLHELLHALDVAHEHQTYVAFKYLTVFRSEIMPDFAYTYDAYDTSVNTDCFDPKSTMMYEQSAFSATGESTYEMIWPDQREFDESSSTESCIFQQLNDRYNCSELYCKNKQVDCSPGYLSLVNKVCSCVCPHEYNSSTNCKTFINQGDSTLTWDYPLSLIAGGENYSCPPDFKPTGWLSFCGNNVNGQSSGSPFPLPTSGKTIYFPICSKTTPKTNIDWNSQALGGRYCFIKTSGIACGGVFEECTIQVQSACKPEFNGTIGDVTINGNTITMKLCCNDHEDVSFLANLPNKTPFRLFMMYGCPNVNGMRVYSHSISLSTAVASVSGKVKPYTYKFSQNFLLYLCYYQPAIYGSSQNVTLSAKNRKVTITTPGYPDVRPPNTRCFYCFYSPERSQIRVTFNDYDLDDLDKIRIKRFNKWAEPSRIDNSNPWYQFVSESNYLCVEFWSGWRKNVSNKGVKFTAEVLLESDSCYDVKQNGIDYLGTMNISETYQDCLPWGDTVDCEDSPINGQEALAEYFESNYCRNPEGHLIQPWCYVWRNGSNCIKRYCDVCNTKVPVDAIKTSICADAISADPTFCQTAVQRFGCFKSCEMSKAPSSTQETCNSPPIPSDGILVGSSKSSYKVGQRAYIQCKATIELDNAAIFLLCTKSGWKGPSTACVDCPQDWILNGDRCFYFVKEADTRQNALAFCRSKKRNGTLMHIKNQADQDFIRAVRTKAKSTYDHSWNGIYMCNNNTYDWCYMDTQTVITYNNWGSGGTRNPNNGASYVYRESSGSNRDGTWVAISGADTTTKMTYFCQIDRLQPYVLIDKYSTCQNILTENPNFCSHPKTANDASIYCAKSCGMSSNAPKCSEPTNSKYTRTSGSGPVSAGDVMTFACKPGYFQTSGDLTRACGLSGSLLGSAPVCISNPPSIDVGFHMVRARRWTLNSNLAVLWDLDGYRVPIKGKVSIWYYYCQSSAIIYFLVYRKSGSAYNLVGSNKHVCITKWRWGYKVPTADQISVQTDDIVGVWASDSDTIMTHECNGVPIQNSLPAADIDSYKDFPATTSFPKQVCLLLSIGFRVTS